MTVNVRTSLPHMYKHVYRISSTTTYFLKNKTVKNFTNAYLLRGMAFCQRSQTASPARLIQLANCQMSPQSDYRTLILNVTLKRINQAVFLRANKLLIH